jgi:hydrogenase 3 maturation protease
VVAALEGRVNAALLDVGEVPESYTGRILAAQADTMVLIDAADFGAAPGDVAVLETEDIAGGSLSTHQLPLDLFFRYLKENSQAAIFGLGIQPAQLTLGAPLSAAVASSVEALAQLLQSLLAQE